MKPFKLDQWIVYRFWRISQEAGFELEDWYRQKHGLTSTEWHSLAVLANHAPLAAKELARILDINPVQMTRTLSKLLAENLVFRNTDETDRRRVVLGLTQKGQEPVRQNRPQGRGSRRKDAFRLQLPGSAANWMRSLAASK